VADSPDLRLMVLSIRPRHVEDILSGLKTVELRRTRPLIGPGQPVVIYATTPAAALVATCQIGHIEVGRPHDVWKSVGSKAAVTRKRYNDYFEGVDVAHALHLSNVQALDERVSLQQLRSSGTFRPPQTWHYLDRQRIESILGVHPSTTVLTSLLRAA
jgi:predicted transcriptional regulator